MEGINPGCFAGLEEAGFHQDIQPLRSQIFDKSLLQNSYISEIEKKELIKKTSEYQLSETINDFIKEYDTLFGQRDHYIWKSLGYVYTNAGVTLSTADKKYSENMIDCKMILTLLCTLIDDVAEKNKDKTLLDEMISIFNSNNEKIDVKNEKTKYVMKLWKKLIENLEQLPGYNEYIDVFLFDMKQFLNAFEYSYLLNNKQEIINLKEMEIYDCHNMIVYLLNGVDVIASNNLDPQDLPYLRKAFWYAQQMARIGNWISTWKRELVEGDMSSAVIAYAISNDIIKSEDIQIKSHEELINIIEQSDAYEYFMAKWKKNYEKLASLKDKIKSVDMEQYIHGLENVIKYHLATEGLK